MRSKRVVKGREEFPTRSDGTSDLTREALFKHQTPKENGLVNDRTSFRLASSLIFGGELLFIGAGIFHPDRVPANQHPEVFAEYANSVYWGAVHMGQFAGMAVLLAGVITFVFALAGAMAGLAGALFVAANRTAGTTFFSIAESIEVVIFVAVGGRGTLAGAILGALLVSEGKDLINENFRAIWPIILGSLFMGVVVFLPDGLIGGVPRLFKFLGRMKRKLMTPALALKE